MTGTRRRDILLANAFNLIAGFYFIIIAVVSLIKLRWYHQITIAVKVRHMIALTSTSYFAFVILIAVGLLLIGIFIASSLTFSARVYINSTEKTKTRTNPKCTNFKDDPNNIGHINKNDPFDRDTDNFRPSSRITTDDRSATSGGSIPDETKGQVYCWTFWHVIASIGLIIIITIWLTNWGELVRQSIANQLEQSYSQYQFTNRANSYSVLIDGMQDINNCCGQFDYSDFPHLGTTGLSYGHYPGSCCGKNIFGSNARVICKPEEIIFFKQTTGCLHVIANYYDMITLLVVPVAMISLLLQLAIILMVTIHSPKRVLKSYQRYRSIHVDPYSLYTIR